MVKFLVLGGAGDMGSAVVEDLVRSGVNEIAVGDLSSERGKEVAERHRGSSTSVSFERVDVNDSRSLASAIDGCDLVINTVGPFFRYEKKIIDVAIERSRDYVDICDDHDATQEVFSRKSTIDAGKSRILVGMGWTPGITNVLARAGYEEVNNARNIDIAWTGSAADATGKAVISHVFHAVTGDIPVYLRGKLESVPARQMKKDTVFPPPINRVETYVVGHPEPITIPLFLKGLENVILRGALLPVWQNHLVGQFADVGLTDDSPVDVDGTMISPREFLSSFVHQTMSQFRSGGAEVSGFYVEVTGEETGYSKTVIFSGADKMRKLTGWSASIGAQFLAEDSHSTPGLYAPEGIIDPSRFIGELEGRNIKVHKKTVREN